MCFSFLSVLRHTMIYASSLLPSSAIPHKLVMSLKSMRQLFWSLIFCKLIKPFYSPRCDGDAKTKDHNSPNAHKSDFIKRPSVDLQSLRLLGSLDVQVANHISTKEQSVKLPYLLLDVFVNFVMFDDRSCWTLLHDYRLVFIGYCRITPGLCGKSVIFGF